MGVQQHARQARGACQLTIELAVVAVVAVVAAPLLAAVIVAALALWRQIRIALLAGNLPDVFGAHPAILS